MERGDSEFANFTLPTLKAFLEARSQNVSGNKQQLVARAIGGPKTHFLPRNNRDLLVSQNNNAKILFSPPSIPFFSGIFCNCNSGGNCTASPF